jgi:hypothetical protein
MRDDEKRVHEKEERGETESSHAPVLWDKPGESGVDGQDCAKNEDRLVHGVRHQGRCVLVRPGRLSDAIDRVSIPAESPVVPLCGFLSRSKTLGVENK